LEAHYQLLLRWNSRINLTRVTDLSAAVRHHYGESVFLATRLPIGVRTVADIGSGGGFPGIPLQLVRPDLEVTLIESDRRKAAFLKEAGARVITGRAEQQAVPFDLLVSRAVAPREVASLVPQLAGGAWMLMSRSDCDGTVWQLDSALPRPERGVVAFHVKQTAPGST
jgi:16S rRNA (guanine527-N7)-methyltransferase